MKRIAVFALSLTVAVATNAATMRVNLDQAWTFSREGETETRIVNLPHDWSIESAPTKDAPTGRDWGFYPAGSATYTRTLELTEADLAGNLELVFDGVFRSAEVSVNGGEAVKGSRYGYTGFRVPLAGKVKAGRNTVAVKANNTALPGSRWYMGSGIYRSVWLEKHTGEYLVPGSLDVRTESIAPESATVRISGVVTNAAGGAAKDVARSFRYDRPRLWTPETPDLYTEDFCGEKVRFGIRTVSADAKRGFLLNGVPVELHGACVHHDHGPLGAASWPEAERRKALQLKRAGFNAVRTSHNPVSEDFIAACDEIGLLVMDDLFDGRERAKTRGDYCEVFKEDWRKDLDWVVRRDRVHPSVVMWSVGNEIRECHEPRAAKTTRKLHDFVDRLDGTRPVTQALFPWGKKWEKLDAMAAALDVVGYNYLEHFTESDHERLPERVIVYTETYPKDVSMVWNRVLKHPYVIGEFVWTGIDYLGETGLGRNFYTDREKYHEHGVSQFPWHGACCGDIDLVGTRRPVSHYRETLWNAKAKTYLAVREPDGWKGTIKTTKWSVWPTHDHWTFPGWEGKTVTAEVYSRAVRVRLTLNGKPVVEKPNGADNAYLVSFDLAYAPGTLLAEGLDANGKVVDRSELKTAGRPDHVRRTAETIGRLTWVTAEVVDKDGTVCPYADWTIDFGPKAIATCSGDMADNVPAPSSRRKAWLGRALGVLRTDL